MEEKKSNKGLRVFVVILIILLVAACSCLLYGYTKYDSLKHDYDSVKKEESETKNESDSNKQYIYNLRGIDCEEDTYNDIGVCSKKLKINYNNSDHSVEVKSIFNNDIYELKYELYEDGSLIDTVSAGNFIPGEEDDVELQNLDDIIYVVDSKYVAFLYTELGFKISRNLIYYNGSTRGKYYNSDTKKNQNYVNIILGGQSLCSTEDCDDGTELNTIKKLEFDGTTFKYYKQSCSDGTQNVLEALTFDGTTVKSEIVQKLGNSYGGGASCD